MADTQFVDGLKAFKPRDNAPSFLKADLAVDREELINWLKDQKSDVIKIQVKESKKGTYYCAVNNYVPGAAAGASNDSGDSLPF